jgi:hypothetical protein
LLFRAGIDPTTLAGCEIVGILARTRRLACVLLAAWGTSHRGAVFN